MGALLAMVTDSMRRFALQPLLDLLVEREPLFEGRVLALGQCQPHHQQLRRVDAEVEAVHA